MFKYHPVRQNKSIYVYKKKFPIQNIFKIYEKMGHFCCSSMIIMQTMWKQIRLGEKYTEEKERGYEGKGSMQINIWRFITWRIQIEIGLSRAIAYCPCAKSKYKKVLETSNFVGPWQLYHTAHFFLRLVENRLLAAPAWSP